MRMASSVKESPQPAREEHIMSALTNSSQCGKYGKRFSQCRTSQEDTSSHGDMIDQKNGATHLHELHLLMLAQ